jgi:hypothetical protein
MSVDSRGDLFITDAQLGTIWQITRDGILQRSYGALGDGPGEFRRPGHVLVKQDTVFAVNGARRRLIAYDRRSGVLFGEREIPSGVRHLVELTDTLYGATLLAASERVLHRLGGSDLPAAHVTGVPGLLEGREQLRVVFDGAALAQLGDQLFGVFQVSDSLYAWPARPGAAGEPTKPSTELIPVRLRHGSRPELLLRATTDQDAAMEAAYGTSIPLAISGVAGQLRVLFYDPERVGSRMLGTHVIAWQRDGVWCEDILPLEPDPRPAVALRGDTVFVFTQAVSDSGRVGASVTTFVLDSRSPCTVS